jgi:hypothetical protein
LRSNFICDSISFSASVSSIGFGISTAIIAHLRK